MGLGQTGEYQEVAVWALPMPGSFVPAWDPYLPQEHPIPMSVTSPWDIQWLLNVTRGWKWARELWQGLGKDDVLSHGSLSSSMRPDMCSPLRTLCLCMGWFLCQEPTSRLLFLTSSCSSFKTHLKITFRSNLPHLLPGGAVARLVPGQRSADVNAKQFSR